MVLAEGLSWVAAILGVTGCTMVGERIRWGWIVFASASAINVYIGMNSGILGMAVASCFYFFLELKGYYTHDKDK